MKHIERVKSVAHAKEANMSSKLASLKNLKISNMSHVIYLRDEFYNGGFGCLMALEALCLVLDMSESR
jgi:hypothetical protein